MYTNCIKAKANQVNTFSEASRHYFSIQEMQYATEFFKLSTNDHKSWKQNDFLQE